MDSTGAADLEPVHTAFRRCAGEAIGGHLERKTGCTSDDPATAFAQSLIHAAGAAVTSPTLIAPADNR